MKLISLIIILSLFSSCTIMNLKSDKFSYRYNENNVWTEFTDWDLIDIKVKLKRIPFELGKKKIVIYNKTKLVLKIVGINDETKTEKGERVMSYNCVDNDGSNCKVILIDKGESAYLIVYYTNLNLCYNVIESK